MSEEYELDYGVLHQRAPVLDLVSTLTKCQEYQTSINYKLSEVMNKFGHFLSNILVDTQIEDTHDNPFELGWSETYEAIFVQGNEVSVSYAYLDPYDGYDSHSEIRVPLSWLVRFDQGDDEDELSEEIIKYIENTTLQKDNNHLQYIKDEAIRLGLITL